MNVLVKRKDGSKITFLCLGFVGAEGGPIRAVCVDPLTGHAMGIPIHELFFDVQPNQKGESSAKRNK